MADLHNPHDTLFRALLSDPGRARDFLRDHLPNTIVGQLAPAPPEILEGGFIESFNGSLRDELLNEEMFDSLDDARRKLALWRYDYNNVRPHSSLGNKTPAEARRALEQFEGSAPGALAQTQTEEYENQTRRLSL